MASWGLAVKKSLSSFSHGIYNPLKNIGNEADNQGCFRALEISENM